MLQIVQAFDRAPIAEIPVDDADALEAKLEAATRAFRDRDRWPKPHERIAVLRRLAALMEPRRDHLAQQIAREGGKPLSDALVEVGRAIDGVLNAAEELRTLAGREIPMGLTPASTDRWAFTTKEPIGVVVAISAFNHPLNLIVHQVVPAIAVGCPVIVKPASATPLSCLDFVRLVHEAGLPEPWCQTLIPQENSASGWRRTRVSLSSASSARHGSAGRCTTSWRPERGRPWSMGASRPPSWTAAPISTASSNRWSRAATTTPDRCACRPSASSSMPTSKPRSWSGSRRGFVRCRSATRFGLRPRWAP